MQKKVHRFETSTHSQWEEEISRGCEEEREGSPILIFPPLNFRIVRMLVDWIGFCSKVSALRVERG